MKEYHDINIFRPVVLNSFLFAWFLFRYRCRGIDVVKFLFIYILVLFAFACGLNQLLWYLAELERQKWYVGSPRGASTVTPAWDGKGEWNNRIARRARARARMRDAFPSFQATFPTRSYVHAPTNNHKRITSRASLSEPVMSANESFIKARPSSWR